MVEGSNSIVHPEQEDDYESGQEDEEEEEKSENVPPSTPKHDQNIEPIEAMCVPEATGVVAVDLEAVPVLDGIVSATSINPELESQLQSFDSVIAATQCIAGTSTVSYIVFTTLGLAFLLDAEVTRRSCQPMIWNYSFFAVASYGFLVAVSYKAQADLMYNLKVLRRTGNNTGFRSSKWIALNNSSQSVVYAILMIWGIHIHINLDPDCLNWFQTHYWNLFTWQEIVYW